MKEVCKMKIAISVQNVTKHFKKNEIILREISLDLAEGEFTAIIGPSGSGKSTLLNLMSGLLRPSNGHVFINNQDIAELNEDALADFRRLHLGHIFQHYHLLSHLTVRENIYIGLSGTSEHHTVEELAALLGIEGILNQFPGQLSGGQQQRVAIARALIKRPRILFCDEATGALDETNSKNVITLLHLARQQYGVTIVFITHNPEIAKTAQRVITIKNGSVYQDRLNEHPITAAQMHWA